MIATLDHVGYSGGDVDGLRAAFTRLGFTTTEPHELMTQDSPSGELRPLGQRSSLAVLKAGYIEVTASQRPPQPSAPGCGLLCLGVDDLEAAHARCLGTGLRVTAPAWTVRHMKHGKRHGEARLHWFMLEAEESPEGRVCFVHNQASELVYPDEVTQHANGALGLDEVCIVASDLQAAAARYARILGIEPDRSPGEALFRLLRGALRLCERAPFEQIYGAALAVPADRFGLVALRVRDLAVAGRALQANRVPYRAAEGAAYVPAVSAAGAALALRRGR
ncbi:MAG TPA: VOC family protein [Steroidobacteraceae bacterium]|nr:VOC family protein [Steroidobacteraceae bacterium]